MARRGALALAVGALFSVPASAEISDTIHPFIATSISHDDNLLRVADTPNGQNDARSDTYKRVDGGVIVERPIGRQVLSGQAKFTRVSFNRFDELDYNGKDLSAALAWELGNHVSGHLGMTYSQTLAPFSDFHSEQRNLRIQKREYVDANWRFHPSWQTHAGFTREKFSYDLEAQRFSNRTEDASEFGVDYLAVSGSRVGVLLRKLKGTYPEHRTIGDAVLDDGYDQDEVKANIYWALSGVTQVQFVGGWVRRSHSFFTLRDDSGTNGRVNVIWKPLGKVQYRAAAWREFAAVEGNFVSSSLNSGASAGATWDATAKIRVEAQLRAETRDFSAIGGGSVPADLSDSSRSVTLGVSYAPKQSITLGVSANRDSRSGSPGIGTNSYTSNGVSFNASAQF
ncbi:MAG: XrtB/PEP-CTERM-associated polysaccharide biosynthesis outer membrane protein EpsL [Pseudomonadota bacterium]